MLEKNDNSLPVAMPVGICHRLFNFIKNSLIAGGFKRVKYGSMEERQPLNATLPNDLDSEIQIQFLETDDQYLESWTPVDEIVLSVHVSEDKDTGNHAQEIMNNEQQYQTVESSNEIESKKGQNKKGSKEDVAADEERRKQKGKNIVSENLNISHVEPAAGELKPASTDRARPRISLVTNINEMSDAFIRNKKEAMMNSILGPRNS
ncbi:hypothetical protein I3842_08G102800 [Carya illinoinensis]|uniref:Uncharacterized protein n=1 Tax=Carya illinoinensis TaxID=32201 RepID=A0A922J9V2_CARIL|nr:hypothetical protein I3842_08G102800 [Carya illinoinensis]